jgi:hypothetical protein
MGMKHYMHSVEHLARVLTAPDIVEHMRRGREEKTKHDKMCRVDVELRKKIIRTTEGLSWAANRALVEQLRRNAGEFDDRVVRIVFFLLTPLGDSSTERHAVKGSEEDVESPC